MKRGERPELVWGLGLAQDVLTEISNALGEGYFMRDWPADSPPQKRDLSRANPLLIWISQAAWEGYPEKTRRTLRDWHASQRVLILDNPGPAPDFEDVLEQGFLTGIRAPIEERKIKDALFRAKEVKSLYDDIYRMTQEIMLEREILARKTDQILFLNRILTRASASLDTASILRHAQEDLNILLPIESLLAAFWQPGEGGELEAEIFLSQPMDKVHEDDWTEYFLQQGHALSGTAVGAYQIGYVKDASGKPSPEKPGFNPKSLLLLPLRAGRDLFGCLCINRGRGEALGKDKAQALHASVNHLALALKNAKLYSEVKVQADHDGLTRIHNRRFFEEHILVELSRHQRYNTPLSLMMLDVDHFKNVNDLMGHQAGDLALREIGRILQQTVRSSDMAARYGGEEFVVILPQTTEEQAWLLAERLREKIEAKVIAHGERMFQVTVSIGVASLKPGALEKREELLERADQALYRAKAAGRNMVCLSGDPHFIPKAKPAAVQAILG
jgi:diguanylate cyclase (GGDEF)-like protein